MALIKTPVPLGLKVATFFLHDAAGICKTLWQEIACPVACFTIQELEMSINDDFLNAMWDFIDNQKVHPKKC